jgi:hypothetical protein
MHRNVGRGVTSLVSASLKVDSLRQLSSSETELHVQKHVRQMYVPTRKLTTAQNLSEKSLIRYGYELIKLKETDESDAAAKWTDFVFRLRSLAVNPEHSFTVQDIVSLLRIVFDGSSKLAYGSWESRDQSCTNELCNEMIDAFKRVDSKASFLSIAQMVNSLYQLGYFEKKAQGKVEGESSDSRTSAIRYFHTAMKARVQDYVSSLPLHERIDIEAKIGCLHAAVTVGVYNLDVYNKVF